ncbi:hypothetical protein N2152v2_002360 [Parachlorella kessleri]
MEALLLAPPEPNPDVAALLSQSLLIQTPLQDVLAALFDRLGSQYKCIVQLQDQLAKEREARELLRDKIDFVVKHTEDGNKALTDEVLRKFEEKLLEFARAAEAKNENSKQERFSETSGQRRSSSSPFSLPSASPPPGNLTISRRSSVVVTPSLGPIVEESPRAAADVSATASSGAGLEEASLAQLGGARATLDAQGAAAGEPAGTLSPVSSRRGSPRVALAEGPQPTVLPATPGLDQDGSGQHRQSQGSDGLGTPGEVDIIRQSSPKLSPRAPQDMGASQAGLESVSAAPDLAASRPASFPGSPAAQMGMADGAAAADGQEAILPPQAEGRQEPAKIPTDERQWQAGQDGQSTVEAYGEADYPHQGQGEHQQQQQQEGGAPLAPAESASFVALLHSKSPALRKVADVVNMLRRRPTVQQSGLLWKLQTSLHDTVVEQERLRSEVETLKSQLELTQQSTSEGLHACNEHIDAVEDRMEQVQVLEDKVNVMGSQVATGDFRLGVVEEQLNSLKANETARSLCTPDEDSLAVLQSHLLSQQQKLQKYMDSLANNINNGIPGQVNSAVNATVMDISRNLERRLAEKLVSKQEIQALSIRVSSKITRDEVERMMRKVQQSIPQAHAPASGVRFKCISCDSDLQPVIFASAPGGGAAAANLRYSQLPSVSPAREPNTVPQPGRPVSPPSILPSAQQSQAMSRAGSASLPRRAGLGAPISWLHQMRRDSSGSYQGRQAGGDAADAASVASWDGMAAGDQVEGGGTAGALPQEMYGTGQGMSRRGSGSLMQLGMMGNANEPLLRPLSREGSGSPMAGGDPRRLLASSDGIGAAGQAEGGSLSTRSSKLALPALSGQQSGASARIKAVTGSTSNSVRGSLNGAGTVPLAAEGSLTIQPAIVHQTQQQQHPSNYSPPRSKRPQTASSQKTSTVDVGTDDQPAAPLEARVERSAEAEAEYPAALPASADMARMALDQHTAVES